MSHERMPGLDVLRSFAILAVLALHAGQLTPGMPDGPRFAASFGWAGVDLFFVLSGFLIGLQVFPEVRARAKNFLPVFYVKRWGRTLPLYFAVLAFYVIVKPRLGYPFQSSPAPYLVFLQNYDGPTDFVPSWSLCIEEQFYLLFPLLALAASRMRLPAAAWLLPVIASFLARLAWFRHVGGEPAYAAICQELMFRTHTHLDGISIGVFLAATHPRWKKWANGPRAAAAAAGALVLAFTWASMGPHFARAGAVYGFLGLAAGFALCIPWFTAWRVPGGLAIVAEKIALLSYGAYIWNDVVSRYLHKVDLASYPWWAVFALYFPVSFFIPWFTYRLVEIPGLNARAYLLRKLR